MNDTVKTVAPRLAVLAFCCLIALQTHAQTVAVKNNLLYDATLTPNLGVEFKLGDQSTAQLFYGWNPWKSGRYDSKRLLHWSLMPEWRYWTRQAFSGHFLGLHALGGEYNVAGVPPITTLKNNHYEGWYLGGGLTYGYAWRLSRHWSLEAALGLGYIHTKYQKYANEECGPLLDCGRRNYVGPTKLALNIVWVLGGKKPEPTEPLPTPEPVKLEEPAPPTFALSYVVPQAEPEKTRELSGQAFLDFPVNQTTIRPDYRNNQRELQKVIETINTVKDDRNTSISHVAIHGYASPEGSYQNNARLAEGRAQAFADYIHSLISLPAAVFSVTSTPEDWQGLIATIRSGEFTSPATASILAIAQDTTLLPDQKERQLKTRHPAEWRQLLADVFPALRHSDYVVTYVVRPFTVEEARQLIGTKPQQLSPNEMFLVAQTYPVGSQDFNDVFEVAVRMFPNDPTANLNAAVSALQRGDVNAADRYLQRAGNSPEAQRARQALSLKRQQPDAVITTE